MRTYLFAFSAYVREEANPRIARELNIILNKHLPELVYDEECG